MDSEEGQLFPVGASNFDLIIKNNYRWVDKSLFIKEFLDIRVQVPAILRPRRFGKSLNLTMLRAFLSLGAKEEDFRNMNIYNYKKAMSHCGKYPVIYVSFKDVIQDTWQDTYAAAWEQISEMVMRHQHEITLEIGEFQKKMKVTFGPGEPPSLKGTAASVMEWLSMTLFKKYNKEVIILVDEYDAFLHKSHQNGFIKEALNFFAGFYSRALKDNSALEKACLAGIMEVTGAGFLSGLNNICFYSIVNHQFSSCFGFTRQELQNSQLSLTDDELNAMFKWYNGYYSGTISVVNPYSSMRAIESKECAQYWALTSGVHSLASFFGPDIRDHVLGIAPLLFSNEHVCHKGFSTKIQYGKDTWDWTTVANFLILAGYLTFKATPGSPREGLIYIPNEEIKLSWQSDVIPLFSAVFKGFTNRIVRVFHQPAISGPQLHRLMQSMLLKASYYDFPDESTYHKLYLGIFLSAFGDEVVTSNIESGHGRYDLCIDLSKEMQRVILFEFKKSKQQIYLERDAKMALDQIIRKKYATSFKRFQCIAIGVAFFQKHVSSCHMQTIS